MSTATWGEPEPYSDDTLPLSLLQHLLQQMMKQFGAQGACIALLDESIGQMVLRQHVRLRASGAINRGDTINRPPTDLARSSGEVAPLNPSGRRITINLSNPSSAAVGRTKQPVGDLSGVYRARFNTFAPSEEADLVSRQHSELFPMGTRYPYGQDLIGYAWRKNEPIALRHEEYVTSFHPSRMTPFRTDVTPTRYLALPISEPPLIDDIRNRKRAPRILGVVVLYQTTVGAGFSPKQIADALAYTERIALYLQNAHLQRSLRRTSDYMQRLQKIAAAFPASVKLSDLVEDVYQFVTSVVDISSMLLTLYDRDTQKIYDVFAISYGKRLDHLLTQPVVALQEERPVWWRVTQDEKRPLQLALNSHEQGNIGEYEELLLGTWSDQRLAESFLLLPMKMFTRVIGSLSLSSMKTNAFRPEDIQVLETMVQIITVSIENAKLYDRSRQALREARQREEALAAMNSALQAISAVLNVAELLHKFVEMAAKLVQAEMCTFLQLSPEGDELIAQAIYDATGQWQEASQQNAATTSDKHDDLLNMIRIPFKDSILEKLVEEASFFYLDPPLLDQLALASEEGGSIFLKETGIEKMLMIPVRYQTEIVGILAVHTPRQNRLFRPKEVGILMAICGQAASAIRNAQLFEEIQEAYAELQRMDTLKDEFIVTASHELRTPLSAISGYASLLKRQSSRITAQQVLRFASKIAGSAQQLSDLVANMTEAAKMGALDKKLELQMGPVQLQAAAEMTASMLSVNIEQKITTHVPPDLWMRCDAMRLRQVLTNLLDNAAKYSSPEGRILLTASGTTLSKLSEDQIDHTLLTEDNDPPVVLVRVCDEGEGIDPEDSQKIFEKFVRAQRSLTTPIRGSGLGLYICRRLVEAMGGRLWLEESTPGEGSVFSFYLPRIEAPIEMSEQDEPELQTT